MSVVMDVRRSTKACGAALAASVLFANALTMPAHAQETAATTQAQVTADTNAGIGASTAPAAEVAPASTATPAAAPAPAPTTLPTPAATSAAESSNADSGPTEAASQIPAQDAPPATAKTEAEAEADSEALPWALRHRRYNTIGGGSGGFYLMDPGSGAVGSVRLQLAFDTYSGKSYLYDKDEVQQDGQSITIGWTPADFMEIYGAVLNRATAIVEDTEDGDQTNSLNVLGDVTLGIKMHAEVTSVLRLGGGVRFMTLGGLGGDGGLLDATGIGLTAAAALDLTGMDDPLPIIGRLNLDYFFDNSASLAENVERDKYDALAAADPDIKPINDESAHLLNRFERLGLGIGRVDMLTIGAGVEFPLSLGTDIYLHPMVEWTLGLPINRQGYDCPYSSKDSDRGTVYSTNDTCVDDAGFVSFPQKITLGARFAPPVVGLSAFAAVDIAITGAKDFTREIVPLTSYRLHFGLAYGYDAEPPPPPVVVEAPAPPPVVVEEAPDGRIIGTVLEGGTGTPVQGATVLFLGKGLSALSTSEAGTFVSYPFGPGALVAEVSHPDYRTSQCTGAIPAEGGDSALRCELTALPPIGSLEATVRDAYGNSLPGAVLHLTGPSELSLTSDPRGHVSGSELPAGDYAIMVEAAGHLARTTKLRVDARETSRIELTLASRPARSSVVRAGNRLLVPTLRFTGDSTQLADGGDRAIAELADLLLRDPAIRRIRIQAPGSGAVSLTRGLLLKQRLVDAGVDGARVEALGGGRGVISISIAERAAY